MPRKHGKATQPDQGIQFTFVNVSDPGERSNTIVSRTIRAQATTYSHRDPARKRRGKNRPRGGKAGQESLSRRESIASAEQEDGPEGSGSLLCEGSDQTDLVSRAAGRLMSAVEMPVAGSKGDPFETSPVPSQPWFGWVLDYYRSIHLPPGIAVVQRSGEEGKAYIDWHMREAMSEPCFFYMQLLNAATPLATQGRFERDIVIWLRSLVVSSLNEAIRDASRMLTIPVLFTVASIALHERLFGDVRTALEIHGPAFSRMLSLKGGIQSLHVPRIGFVLLKFTDDVLSSRRAEMSTADLLHRWAPSEMRAKYPGYGAGSSG